MASGTSGRSGSSIPTSPTATSSVSALYASVPSEFVNVRAERIQVKSFGNITIGETKTTHSTSVSKQVPYRTTLCAFRPSVSSSLPFYPPSWYTEPQSLLELPWNTHDIHHHSRGTAQLIIFLADEKPYCFPSSEILCQRTGIRTTFGRFTNFLVIETSIMNKLQ